MSLNDTIKRIAKHHWESSQPVAVMYGVVTNINPLEVNVDQRLSLPADFLVVPEHLTAYSVTVDGQQVVIRRGLEEGDRLVLLRVSGGKDYVIIGRLP